MRLVMYYRIGGDNRLFCDWKKITEKDKILRVVIDFVRSLKGWEHCIFCGFIRYGQNIGDESKAFFFQDIDDEKEGSKRMNLNVRFYVDLEHQETTTREEFCMVIERLYPELPHHMRKLFTDFAMDPETTDIDLDEVMNTIMTTLPRETCSQV